MLLNKEINPTIQTSGTNSIEQLSDKKLPLLITVPVSHYCEKVRWALERLNFPYIQECHIPLFHLLANWKNGAGKTLPVFVIDGVGTLNDSTEILQYLERFAPTYAKLYPGDSQLRLEVEHLEEWFNTQLGPCVARWAYFYLLQDYKLVRRLWCEGTPKIERALFPVIFPVVCSVFRRRLRINSESATSAYKQIKCIFDTVGQRLADGRTYLVGDRFSAADLTFASLAAPAVFATDYRGVILPQLNELPSQMVAKIQELRETPAGIYAMRIFSEERTQVE